jgi:hypothetical protein
VTVHFIHIGKTGGTAIKHILRKSGRAYRPEKDEEPNERQLTPYGPLAIHPHRFQLKHVPEGDFAFFCLRDPIERFFSAWYSRQNEGRPRYYVPWSDEERVAYETYPTPQALAGALAAGDERAKWAMDHILHVPPMWRKVVRPADLESRMDHILYIARQETLASDWENIKRILQLPPRLWLPEGYAANKGSRHDTALDDAAHEALREYYKRDYRLLRVSERIRQEKGWAKPPEPKRGGVLKRVLGR